MGAGKRGREWVGVGVGGAVTTASDFLATAAAVA